MRETVRLQAIILIGYYLYPQDDSFFSCWCITGDRAVLVHHMTDGGLNITS